MSAFLHGLELLDLGYSPIWVDHADGLPHMKGWDQYRSKAMHPETVRWWASLKPSAGLAVCGGFNGLVPIDVDSSDPEVKAAFLSVMPRPLVARFGTKGFGCFYRGKVAGKNFMLPKDANGDTRPLIEIKANGVLTIPPTLHRKSGRPYRWMQCLPGQPTKTLFNTRVDEHPEITPEHIAALEKVLAPWCPPMPVFVPKVVVGDAPIISDKRMHACAMGAVRRAVAHLSALSSDRNIQLRIKARSLGKFVHHKVLTEDYVRDQLMAACVANQSKKKHGERQCLWTIASGFKAAANDDLPVLEDRPYQRNTKTEERVSA